MNPYIHRSMITAPEAFFGRKAELRRIFDLLSRPSSINVIGNRRIGKSSLLAQVSHPSVYRSKLQNPGDYLFVFVDLQELAELNQPRFFATVMSRAAEASGGEIPGVDAEEADVRTFRRFIRRHCQPSGRWKLVCCFDEFEKMSHNESFDVAFFHQLRALAQQYSLGYVISSRTGIEELCHRGDIHGSQFWNIFAFEHLRLMTRQEAATLITTPFDQAGHPLSAKEVDFIFELAGTYPFFVQVACFHLFGVRQAKDTLSRVDLEAIRDRFLDEVRYHFGFMLEQLEDEARSCLYDLASGTQRDPSAPAARELFNQSLIAIEGGTPSIFSDAFRSFVLQRRGAKALAATSQEKEPDAREATGQPEASGSRGPILSICLWRERSAVVELKAPRRLYSLTETSRFFDATTVEDWRRRAEQIYASRERWRENLRRTGSELFGEIFLKNPKINGAFSAGLAQQASYLPLELVFRMPRELMSLPVELQFEEEFASGEEGPLALLHPVARYVTELTFDRSALRLPLMKGSGLRILLLAGADGVPPQVLDLAAELDPLARDLQRQDAVERVDVVWSREHSCQEIQGLLAGRGYDVVHYAGHGTFVADDAEASGLLFFEDGPDSPVVSLTTGALQDLLRGSTVRLFFLNACLSGARGDLFQKLDRDFLGIIDALIVARIPTIIGLRWPIRDASAVTLSHCFYEALFETGSPTRALWMARRALARQNRNDPAWASPILIMQEE